VGGSLWFSHGGGGPRGGPAPCVAKPVVGCFSGGPSRYSGSPKKVSQLISKAQVGYAQERRPGRQAQGTMPQLAGMLGKGFGIKAPGDKSPGVSRCGEEFRWGPQGE
jgi:hypothetical protein